FSLSDCSMTTANKYLTWLIDFCFENNIGFKTKTWDMLPDDYAMVMRCCKHRKCIICLNHADIDHTFGLVGIGRDRRTVDNSKSYFLPLCRKHHQERHNLGAKNFLNKYHIKPVKLNAQTRKELRIGK
ncbi:MAG: putative HNHc nuclease, partial [Bombilactobacillus sp.]|nr:putative HNHc nuclease [Bombilactobacillus sp.]